MQPETEQAVTTAIYEQRVKLHALCPAQRGYIEILVGKLLVSRLCLILQNPLHP
jgi:hypothetical protein